MIFFIAGAVRAQGMDGQLNSSCWRTGECYKKGNTIKCRKQSFAPKARTSLSPLLFLLLDVALYNTFPPAD